MIGEACVQRGDFGAMRIGTTFMPPELEIPDDMSERARMLEQVMIAGPAGVQIVPASSGLRTLTALSPAHRAILAAAFARLNRGCAVR